MLLTAFFAPLFQSISLRDRAFFFRQMGLMVASGIPFARALVLAGEQTSNQTLKQIVHVLALDIESGRSFSDTARRFPQIFDATAIAMIVSGEASGQLQAVLGDIADQLERELRFGGRARGALLYPFLVIVTMIVVALFMTVFIVPRLTRSFTDVGLELPWMTQVLMHASYFLIHYWYALLLGFIVVIFAAYRVGQSSFGRDLLASWRMALPIIRNVTQATDLVHFSSTLAMLLRSGIPITEGLKMVSQSAVNPVLARAITSVGQEVERGTPLSAAMARHTVFPQPLVQMIGVGEQTGKVDTVLGTMTDFYDDQADNALKALSSLIEPLALILVAAGVGFVVLSVIFPIYSLAERY